MCCIKGSNSQPILVGMAIDINKHFGRMVRKYRSEQELSQLQLSELAKVDLSTVNRIERGIENITLRNVFKITKALKIPVYKFFLVDKEAQRLERRGDIEGQLIDQY